ncbi:Fc.00g016040.m01.CDS01 [Cosmosporella sp. VM-42]
MPTTRRSTGSVRGRPAPAKGQSTLLSFSNRVTKSVPKDAKKAIIAPSVAKVELPQEGKQTNEDEVKEVVIDEPEPAEPEEEEGSEAEVEAVPEKSDAELRAEKITEVQISKYWKSLENQRKAPRVHQQGLSLSEKVLRYFDVSSQYGPCIGIDRAKRWTRAERLGLNPPIEVLAVLQKEESKGAKGIETAHMDDILNSTSVGS